MSHEIFDVVNDRDQVIGKQTRAQVHRLGLKHRAVHVFVFNAKGHIYLQKRSQKKDTFPGAWDSSASGHLDAGEHYDACAARELREEIGVAGASPPKRVFKVEACADTGQEFVWLYRLPHEGPFKLDPEEVDFGAFFRPEDVDRWTTERPRDFARSFLLLWKWFRHGKPKPKAKAAAKKSTVRKSSTPKRKSKPTKAKSSRPASRKAPPAKQRVRSTRH